VSRICWRKAGIAETSDSSWLDQLLRATSQLG
jgi:hypothetical protein